MSLHLPKDRFSRLNPDDAKRLESFYSTMTKEQREFIGQRGFAIIQWGAPERDKLTRPYFTISSTEGIAVHYGPGMATNAGLFDPSKESAASLAGLIEEMALLSQHDDQSGDNGIYFPSPEGWPFLVFVGTEGWDPTMQKLGTRHEVNEFSEE